MEETEVNFQRFQAIATIVLATLMGYLIVLPIVLSATPNQSTPLLIIGPMAGGMVGYRNRHSRFFFYLTIVGVLTLSTILSFQN